MASQYDLPYTGPQVETLLAKISELESEMPSKTSDLTNDSGFITSENVPTKTSDLNNDSGFITNAPVAAEAARAQAAEALLATISSLQAEISRATGVEGTLQDLIDGIAAKIPSAATAQNQLADKSYVNASIATASATFRGTYISLVALQSVAADENDYGYVISTDSVGNTIYNRYKYANSTWTFEYAIANPVFDSSQWAAINSAITAELVAKLSALPNNATLTAALAAKQDVIDDLSSIRSKANSAYQKPSGGIPASDIADGVIPDIADNLTTNDATKALSAKQGKVLNENLTQLGQEVNAMVNGLSQNTGIIINKGWMNADGISNYFADSTHAVIPIESGQTVDIIPKAYSTAVIAFLSNYERISQNGQQYDIIGNRYAINIGTSLVAPENARFLFVGLIGNGQNLSPESVVIDGYDYVGSIYNAVSTLSETVSTLSETIFTKEIETTLTQGYASASPSSSPVAIEINELATRVRSYIIQGNYTVKTNPGYAIRAIVGWSNGPTSGNPTASFQPGLGNVGNIVSGMALAEYTKNDDWPYSIITFCKTDTTADISPNEDIIAKLIVSIGLVDRVEQLSNEIENIAIHKAVFMGDSITHGVYSYWHSNVHAEMDRYNGFDISSLTNVAEATAYHGIPYYFGLLAKCPNPVINLAKRGTGYVADTRGIGNALAVVNGYDFSDVDFVALCFGVNDYIQGEPIGDLTTRENGTLIGNMCAVIEKILTDNPLCKVVVYSPYNTWGQVSYGGDYTSNILYGSEATNYALGHNISGQSLQDIIDAENSVCEYYGIQHVALSKSNVINRITIKNILIDGLHPSKESYIKLAAEIYGKGNFGD